LAKFLVVDDSKTGRHIAKEKLGMLCHEILGEAEDGFQAISKYRELKPDFVLMDINMPKLDGIGASKEILREFPDAKIFLLTSESGADVRHGAIDVGVTEFLIKPLDIDELKDKIKRNL
jgi:two-component system chemotaxis response regulator CheY